MQPERGTRQLDDQAISDLEMAADEANFLIVSPDQVSKNTVRESRRVQKPPKIPGYQLHEKVGMGGTSSVYRATRLSDQKQVAVKVLAREHGEKLLLRYHREIEALQRLDHPNIAKIIDSGTSDSDELYMVLQYIDGSRIDTYCDQEELTLQQRANLLIPICQAVQHAHDRGILHRDLKPGNVLVDQEGQPFVTDFGFAKIMEQVDYLDEKTRTGAILGTLNYLAPEQIFGPQSCISPRTDVFGLGALFHVLLVHRAPFQFRSVIDALASYYEKFPVRLQSDQGVPADMEAVCIKCLSPNPNARYASATLLMEELQRLEAGRPVLAKRHLLRRQLDILRRQYPWLARISVATLIGIILSAITFLFLWQRSDHNYRQAVLAIQQRNETWDNIRTVVREWQTDPGTMDLRRDLLELIAKTYDQEDALPSSTEEKMELADVYYKLALIYSYNTNQERATHSYERCLAAYNAILEEEADHELAQFGKFHCLNSLTRYEESAAAILPLVQAFPENADYVDAFGQAELTLASAAINRLDFGDATKRLVRVGLWHPDFRDQNFETSNSLRLYCKYLRLQSQVDISQGKLNAALAKVQEILRLYQTMDLDGFATSGESHEFFLYSTYGISLAATLQDQAAISQMAKDANKAYAEARDVYQQFTNHRYWFLRCCMEQIAYYQFSDQPDQIPEARNQLQLGFADWANDQKQDNDYWALIYRIKHSNLSSAIDLPDELLKLVEEKILEQENYLVRLQANFRSPKWSGWQEFEAKISDTQVEQATVNWFLSRAGRLQQDDPRFVPETPTPVNRRAMLFRGFTYLDSHPEQLYPAPKASKATQESSNQ